MSRKSELSRFSGSDGSEIGLVIEKVSGPTFSDGHLSFTVVDDNLKLRNPGNILPPSHPPIHPCCPLHKGSLLSAEPLSLHNTLHVLLFDKITFKHLTAEEISYCQLLSVISDISTQGLSEISLSLSPVNPLLFLCVKR